MTTEWIKDAQGKIIARIDTQVNGSKYIRDAFGKILGRYDKDSNLTRDANGRIVARGECLTMLIGR